MTEEHSLTLFFPSLFVIINKSDMRSEKKNSIVIVDDVKVFRV